MDLQMPVMDGYEATKKIRTIDSIKAKNIPIIAVSANGFDKDAALASKVGMNEHFPKPVSMERMLTILKKYLAIEKDQ
jgi:CheY-like chemotaxis protein